MKKMLVRIICEIFGAILGIAVALFISSTLLVTPEQELNVIITLSPILMIIGAIVGGIVGDKIA